MEIAVRLSAGGRLVIPAKFRKTLALKAGDVLILRLEGRSIRMIPLQQTVLQAQELVRKNTAELSSLDDELIQARRNEANNE